MLNHFPSGQTGVKIFHKSKHWILYIVCQQLDICMNILTGITNHSKFDWLTVNEDACDIFMYFGYKSSSVGFDE